MAGAVGQLADDEANSAKWPVRAILLCDADCVHEGREKGLRWTALVATVAKLLRATSAARRPACKSARRSDAKGARSQ